MTNNHVLPDDQHLIECALCSAPLNPLQIFSAWRPVHTFVAKALGLACGDHCCKECLEKDGAVMTPFERGDWARQVLAVRVGEYYVDEKPPTFFDEPDYIAAAARTRAFVSASLYVTKWGGDHGTFNFDSAVVAYSPELERALDWAGFRTRVVGYGLYEGMLAVSSPIPSACGLNTTQAEAISHAFEEYGLETFVRYLID
jgi:hypothetical protein